MERLALALLLLPALLAPSRGAEACDIDTVDGSELSAADFQTRYDREKALPYRSRFGPGVDTFAEKRCHEGVL